MTTNEVFWGRLSEPSPVKPGTRIRLLAMPSDPDPVTPGSEGVVLNGSTAAQLLVKWDNGRMLSVLPDIDSYEIVEESEEEGEERAPASPT